jgi:2-(3-amino-3-carboxypropyl)histidine synthase
LIHVNWEKVEEIVKKDKPKSVIIVGPDGIIDVLLSVASKLESIGVKAFVSGDPSYGSCDLQTNKAIVTGADLIFNIGHTIGLEKIGNVRFIDLEYLFDDQEIKIIADLVLNYINEKGLNGKIGFYTISNYRSAYIKLLEFLKGKIEVAEAAKYDTLLKGQILGCNFYSAFIPDVKYNFFLGESIFHAIGLQLSTEKDTFIVDPHVKEIQYVGDEAKKYLKASFARIALANNAEKIGIIIGEKEGQANLQKAEFISKQLETFGVKTFRIIMNEITPEKVNKFQKIEAFVETACPRIPMNVEGFEKPLLSYPEALALIKLKKKLPVENPFRGAVWY